MKQDFEITDLMLNDIVLCHGVPVQIASIIDDGTIGFETREGEFIEDEFDNMEPIEITDQLLEDGLFKFKKEGEDVVFRFTDKREAHDVRVDLKWNFPTETWIVNIYGVNGDSVVIVPTSTGEVKWLHELQHYFKRYRINTIWDVSVKLNTEG